METRITRQIYYVLVTAADICLCLTAEFSVSIKPMGLVLAKPLFAMDTPIAGSQVGQLFLRP